MAVIYIPIENKIMAAVNNHFHFQGNFSVFPFGNNQQIRFGDSDHY